MNFWTCVELFRASCLPQLRRLPALIRHSGTPFEAMSGASDAGLDSWLAAASQEDRAAPQRRPSSETLSDWNWNESEEPVETYDSDEDSLWSDSVQAHSSGSRPAFPQVVRREDLDLDSYLALSFTPTPVLNPHRAQVRGEVLTLEHLTVRASWGAPFAGAGAQEVLGVSAVDPAEEREPSVEPEVFKKRRIVGKRGSLHPSEHEVPEMDDYEFERHEAAVSADVEFQSLAYSPASQRRYFVVRWINAQPEGAWPPNTKYAQKLAEGREVWSRMTAREVQRQVCEWAADNAVSQCEESECGKWIVTGEGEACLACVECGLRLCVDCWRTHCDGVNPF